jgi:hypothetical protein
MIEIDRAPAGLPIGGPQRLYVLNLNDIAAGRGFSAVKPMAWRFYMGSLEGPAISLTVREPSKGKGPKMTSLGHGYLIQQVFKEILEVESLTAVKNRDFELRRLKVPSLLGAFWLKSLTTGADLIVPHFTLLRRFKRMRPYSVDTFLTLLRRFAEERMRKRDAPRAKKRRRS